MQYIQHFTLLHSMHLMFSVTHSFLRLSSYMVSSLKMPFYLNLSCKQQLVLVSHSTTLSPPSSAVFPVTSIGRTCMASFQLCYLIYSSRWQFLTIASGGNFLLSLPELSRILDHGPAVAIEHLNEKKE
jgi:hypothetical protein